MKYRVYAKMVSYCYIDIEADSKEEAEMFAEDIDGGEFDLYHNGIDESFDIIPDMTKEVN